MVIFMYINRALEKRISDASNQFRALIVTGPRQVGKTTLLNHIAGEGREYVTLDDPIEREMAVSEPALFMERHKAPVIIDEIQYAPNLLPYIKMHVDTQQNKGDFWLTGSQKFHMMKNVSESLAGRIAVIEMYGLSQSEIGGYESGAFTCDHVVMSERYSAREPLSLEQIYERIFKGSMPEAYTGDFNREEFYSGYVNTYLERDIRSLTQVADELDFLRFMTACAARTSEMVNYADLAKDVGISAPTAKQWLSILVSSGIVTLIQPYFNNMLKRAIKSPNMYFMDTGLAVYLTRWDSSKTLEVSAMSGKIFETYVVSEILKSYHNAGIRPPIYYYRDMDGKEIDLILEYNDTVYPIEIKKTGNPGKDTIKNFAVLQNSGKQVGEGAVVCLYNKVIPIDKNNWIIPVWLV
ncbi:MAG: ATP-binding protein [Oscillospiraceae bacterium]|nr:ATP-binding protein [Oscillospiraceae bacterium]